MTKIKLNNFEYQIDSYSRNTSIMDGNITSTAYMSLVNGDAVSLNNLFGVTITSIDITVDGNKIYELVDINAKVDSINEFLSGDRMGYNMNISFQQGE